MTAITFRITEKDEFSIFKRRHQQRKEQPRKMGKTSARNTEKTESKNQAAKTMPIATVVRDESSTCLHSRSYTEPGDVCWA